MAINVKTVYTYPLDSSTLDYLIPFEYLARKFIRVTLIGETRKELKLVEDYRIVDKTKVTLNRSWSPSDGFSYIEIRRFTSVTDRLVDFSDGSILRAADLNISQIQTLHVAEEARDLMTDSISINEQGQLDARGRRIVNVADGIDDGDVVTIRQMKAWDEGALQQANRAEREADRAESEADRAKGYADGAKASEERAILAETNAKTSEANAKTSETNAKESERIAKESIGITQGHVEESKKAIEETRKNADRAEEAANRVNDVMTHVSNIEKLKALDYAPNNTHVYVDSYYEGKNMGGGIFVLDKDSTETPDDGYMVAASGGGVWKRYVETHLTFDMFGADRTGVENTYHQLVKCFDAAHSLGLKVIQTTGRFKISGGNGNIYIKVNTDLSGCTLYPSNWGGHIIITRDHEWESFEPTSPLVKALQDNTEKNKGDSMVVGWRDMLEMDDCYIRYETDQPLFKYRSKAFWRTEYNVVFAKGQLAAPLLYNLPNQYKVTKLYRLRMSGSYLVVNGITIDESEYTSTYLIRIMNATKVKLNNTVFYNRGEYKAINVTRLAIEYSAYVYVDTIHCSDVNATPDNKYTYTYSGVESFEVHLKGMTSDGHGWGSTGSNNCQRVSFSDSQLSRIDFHLPCREYLKVKNCTIGNWGILVTMMGDLHVEDCTWLTRNAYNNSGFIRTRSDAGGWCDGDLFIKNCKIQGKPFNPQGIMMLGLLNCQVDATQGYIDGSPINFTFFNTVNIDGLYIAETISSSFRLLNANSRVIYIPKIINISNMEAKNYTMIVDFNQFKPHNDDYVTSKYSGNTYPQFNIDNLTVDTLNVIGATNTHFPVFHINNMKNPWGHRQGTLMEPVFKGRYHITNSELSRIKTYSGGFPQNPVSVTMNGGKLGNNSQIPVDANASQSIFLDNVDILFPSGHNDFIKVNQLLTRCNFHNCRFYTHYDDRVTNKLYVAGDVQSMNHTVEISNRVSGYQTLNVTVGYDSQGTTSTVEIPLADSRFIRRFLIANGELKVVASAGSSGNVKIELTSADAIRYIHIK
ncbi:MAG: hypothetical protein [Caudoviricetes sp.]|nr:MAG: hypothetical protein [Caudoviricetes sp.]